MNNKKIPTTKLYACKVCFAPSTLHNKWNSVTMSPSCQTQLVTHYTSVEGPHC